MAGLLQETELFGADFPRLEGLREKGRAAFELPTAKTEAWKYTRLSSLTADDFVILPSAFLDELSGREEEEACGCQECGCHHHNSSGCDCGCTGGCCKGNDADCGCATEAGNGGHMCCHCHDGEKCEDDGHCHHCSERPFSVRELHFDNGKFVPVYPAMPRNVEVMTLLEALVIGEERHLLGKYIDMAAYPFAALNTAYLEEGLFIRIGKNTCLDQPLMLINHSRDLGVNRLSCIRNLIVLEEGASAVLVEHYDYEGDPQARYFNNVVNEIYLSAGAELRHYRLQSEAVGAVHMTFNAVRIKSSGKYKAFCLQKGAYVGRYETRVQLLEEDAAAEINAAYVAGGRTTSDITTNIEHLAPETYSSQLIKGVVDDEAKGVFQGKIHIAPDAQETEGRQLHKALLLSDTAEADAKPELEIYADNVKCSHGATCGELDKEQLFYMRSRGIGENEARRILIDAYLSDVVDRIEDDKIREWFTAQI